MGIDEFTWDEPVRSFADTWRRVILAPREFFAVDRAGSGLQAPIGFLVVTLLLAGAGLAVFGGGLSALPRVLAGGLIRVLAAALVVWLVATRVFPGRGDYEATVRVLGYASATAVFLCVPGVRVLAELYGLFLAVVGLERAHGLDTAQAVLTLLIAAYCATALALAAGLDPAALLNPALSTWP